MIDCILLDGLVITMDKKRNVIKKGAVAIDKGKIIYVGDSEEVKVKYSAKEVIVCSNHIIMPGFIDAHGHAGHTAFRFVVKDTRYWMPAMTHTYKHYVTDDFWYIEGRVSALERVKAGVTTGVCVMGSQPRCDDPIFAINNAKAYAEVGIRDIVCSGPSHVPWPHNFSRWSGGKRTLYSVSFEQAVSSLEKVIKTLNNTNGGKTYAYVTPFGMVTSINPSGATPKEKLTKLTEHDKLQAREMLRIAKEYNTRIHSDCFGGMLYLAMQDLDNAVLGPHVHLQHCSYLSDEEVKILADTGTHATAAPGSHAPIHRMLDMGVSIAATTDGPKSGAGLDMFACMRQFQQAYREIAQDSNLLPHEKMLELVTIDAAKVVGLDHMIGSLEVGKCADIITVNLMNPRLTPNFNPLHSLVMSAQGCDVDNVLVDGEFVVRDYKVLTVDERTVLTQAQKEAEETIERAKLNGFAYLHNQYWGMARKTETEELFDIEWQRQDGGHY
ncbi:amidohydrolase family protein [Paenibacillus sp. GCM10027629]